MKNLLLFLFAILLFSSCSNDPEGVWQNDEAEHNKIVVIKNESEISVRLPGSRRWINFISIGGDEYMSRSNPNKFKFLSKDKMQFTNPSRNLFRTYSKIVLDGDASVLNLQMTREQVRKLIGDPEEIFEEKLAENWRYENGLLLLFDDKGIFKIKNN